MRTVVALILTAIIGIVIGSAGDEDARLAMIVHAAQLLALPASCVGAWLICRTDRPATVRAGE